MLIRFLIVSALILISSHSASADVVSAGVELYNVYSKDLDNKGVLVSDQNGFFVSYRKYFKDQKYGALKLTALGEKALIDAEYGFYKKTSRFNYLDFFIGRGEKLVPFYSNGVFFDKIGSFNTGVKYSYYLGETEKLPIRTDFSAKYILGRYKAHNLNIRDGIHFSAEVQLFFDKSRRIFLRKEIEHQSSDQSFIEKRSVYIGLDFIY